MRDVRLLLHAILSNYDDNEMFGKAELLMQLGMPFDWHDLRALITFRAASAVQGIVSPTTPEFMRRLFQGKHNVSIAPCHGSGEILLLLLLECRLFPEAEAFLQRHLYSDLELNAYATALRNGARYGAVAVVAVVAKLLKSYSELSRSMPMLFYEAFGAACDSNARDEDKADVLSLPLLLDADILYCSWNDKPLLERVAKSGFVPALRLLVAKGAHLNTGAHSDNPCG